MEEANIKLESVLSDVMGRSGRAMIQALIAGETDPAKLAALAHPKVRAPQARLREALRVTVINSNFVFLGFLWTLDGTVVTIAVPGSTSTFVGSGTGINAGPAINPAGVITGSYADASGAIHGFPRARDGTLTTFDAPGAVNGTDFVCCITPAGAVAGISFDANFTGHGFLRAPNGTFTVFDPQGSTSTSPAGINPEGVLTGDYFDANGVERGFLRSPDGAITTFDPPGSAPPFRTTAVEINPAGAIVGTYFDGITFHGFLRAPDDTITTVEPPRSAISGAFVINPAGVIAGTYGDASGAGHGFVFLPH